MNAQWKLRRLDELGLVARGKSRHRPRNEARLYGGPYPFVQTAEVMSADPYITSYSQTYSEFGLQQSKIWPPDTLCMTIAGANTAKTAILKIKACFPDSIVGFIPDKSKADIHFVKYSLDLMRDRFLSVSRGATQDNLSLEKLLSFLIPAPGVGEQRRIGAILSAYDELMENCRLRIRILEEMARALYREWFVEFRSPGYEKVARIRSALGPIPKGWEVKPFSALATYVNGYAFKPSDWGDEGKPIIKIRELKVGITDDTPRNSGEKIPAKYNVTDGDVLFSWSADLDTYLWKGGEGLLNQHLFNVIPVEGLSRAFCFHCLKEAMPSFRALSLGATMHHIKRSALDQLSAIIPPAPLRACFNSIVEPMHQQLIALSQSITILRRTRDLLLPRLLSGQIAVDVAEKEEVAA
jgi:type I restriction enzyme S subunit